MLKLLCKNSYEVYMIKDFLDKKQCFKLVCGAGNEDANEVEKLVLIYSTYVQNLKS